MTVISPKKLIEVALPLDAINTAAAREKSIRHGHPSTLHLWWARRPLAAARAVIFAQLVHDPEDLWRCQNPGVEPNPQVTGHWTKARARLFKIIEDLVLWENTTNEAVLKPAREAIRQSWRETCELNKDHPQAKDLFDPAKMPGLHDPFAGGGSIPLEAQRLGLEAFASDLNPVAVLINKAMIEIPPKFAGRPPVHPEATNLLNAWSGAAGLAEDIRRYGAWMRDEAHKRIGHLYPPIEITKAMVKDRPDLEQYVGKKLTVIAWLWARTVKSPNPAFSHVDVPLASSFILSSKDGKESYVEPVVGKVGLHVHGASRQAAGRGEGRGTSFGKQKGFRCLMSRTTLSGDVHPRRSDGRSDGSEADGDCRRRTAVGLPLAECFSRKPSPSPQRTRVGSLTCDRPMCLRRNRGQSKSGVAIFHAYEREERRSAEDPRPMTRCHVRSSHNACVGGGLNDVQRSGRGEARERIGWTQASSGMPTWADRDLGRRRQLMPFTTAAVRDAQLPFSELIGDRERTRFAGGTFRAPWHYAGTAINPFARYSATAAHSRLKNYSADADSAKGGKSDDKRRMQADPRPRTIVCDSTERLLCIDKTP